MSRIPTVPTLGQMVEVCAHNRDVADFQIRRLTQQLEGVPPGLERERLLGDLSRYRSDFGHWAEYVRYYRERVGREGELAVPPMGGAFEAVVRRRERAAEPDRRLPREREIGDDDGDDKPPF